MVAVEHLVGDQQVDVDEDDLPDVVVLPGVDLGLDERDQALPPETDVRGRDERGIPLIERDLGIAPRNLPQLVVGDLPQVGPNVAHGSAPTKAHQQSLHSGGHGVLDLSRTEVVELRRELTD